MLNAPVSGLTSLAHLQAVLDSSLGKRVWYAWEPETLLFEMQPSDGDGGVDPLLKEKVLALQILGADLNGMLAYPEFLLRYVAIANNESADFDHINVPNSLEIGWAIEEAKKIGTLTDTPFEPTEELADIVAYVLKEEGYSEPVYPFTFVPPSKLTPGQTPEDTKMKSLAIAAYLKHMQEISLDSIKA